MSGPGLTWKRNLLERKPVTVVAYGDSWTYGSVAEGWHEARENGLNPDLIHGSWVSQLRRHLQQMNERATVHNSGKGGWTSAQGLDGFDKGVGELKPDLLILNFGINDWRKPISVEAYRANIELMLEKAEAIGCASLLWTSGPVSAVSGETYGWKQPLEDTAYPEPFARYNDTLRSIAAERGLLLADAEKDIQSVWRSGTDISGWFYDSFHFTQNGHDHLFRSIRSKLDEVVIDEI
ncbi:SGNH/GDSL hydrolase family protein [Paenibacillus hodogayensis]|uniref:SGNH/GDSL hydrolase family protein n=1 Tax=Paenibacillus hodogayensis TaxID=279208 RepID=A0ABV5VUW5_9BACL